MSLLTAFHAKYDRHGALSEMCDEMCRIIEKFESEFTFHDLKLQNGEHTGPVNKISLAMNKILESYQPRKHGCVRFTPFARIGAI